MNLATIFSVVLVIGMSLGIVPGCARGQFFPNAKMTEAFQRVLDELASKNGGAFVSACRGPGRADMAVLVVGVGSNRGTLSLLTSGNVYNGAGFEIEGGRMNFVEGGGGEWSRRRLEFYAHELGDAAFHLNFPTQLRVLLTAKPKWICPEFKDTGTLPSAP